MTESETENTVNSDNPPLPEAETETQVRPEPDSETDSEPERLQKVLSRAGVASRRASEDLIAQGRVQINGETVREMGVKVLPTDRITVDGQRVHTDTVLQVWAFHKPVGTVSSMQPEAGEPNHAPVVRSPENLRRGGARPGQDGFG